MPVSVSVLLPDPVCPAMSSKATLLSTDLSSNAHNPLSHLVAWCITQYKVFAVLGRTCM